jgi:dipeptidyl aminopeptidase/acylaminoacyl peptidase
VEDFSGVRARRIRGRIIAENLGEMDVTWSPDGTQPGRLANANTGNTDIQLVDPKTRQVSSFPGSKGLFSPRWSPDGHYLAAVNVEVSKKLMLYDFGTQKWSEWLTDAANFDYPQWSADSRYVYWDTFASSHPKCRGIKVGGKRREDRFGLNALRRYFGVFGSWSGEAKDDSRLFVRDASTPGHLRARCGFPLNALAALPDGVPMILRQLQGEGYSQSGLRITPSSGWGASPRGHEDAPIVATAWRELT